MKWLSGWYGAGALFGLPLRRSISRRDDGQINRLLGSLDGCVLRILGVSAISACLAVTAAAQTLDDPWDVRLGASTAGVQLSASYGLTEYFKVRGVAGGLLTFRSSLSLDDNEYSGNLNLGGIGLFGDLYPFRNGFRVSGGVLYSLTTYGASAEGTLEIGDEVVDGRVDLDLSFSPAVVPAFTVGYDLPLGKNWMLSGDIGIIYPLGYDAKLTINGETSVDLDDLIREADRIEVDAPDIFPYASIGLVYRF